MNSDEFRIKKEEEEIRKIVIKQAYKNNLSHLASCLSCIEILVNIFYSCLEEKDNFILSKGHAGLALYALLLRTGKLKEIDYHKLKTHPEKDSEIGIPFTTGSLGMGLPFACGLSLAERNNNTYVLLSEGDCDEGSTWEAAKIARDNNLNNLIVIVDANSWQCYKKAENYKDIEKKWKSFGWKTKCLKQKEKMDFRNNGNKPMAFIVKTIKGKGLELEDTLASHYYKISEEKYEENIK